MLASDLREGPDLREIGFDDGVRPGLWSNGGEAAMGGARSCCGRDRDLELGLASGFVVELSTMVIGAAAGSGVRGSLKQIYGLKRLGAAGCDLEIGAADEVTIGGRSGGVSSDGADEVSVGAKLGSD